VRIAPFMASLQPAGANKGRKGGFHGEKREKGGVIGGEREEVRVLSDERL